MANHFSIRGFVSSEFEMSTTDNGLVIAKFRMGSSARKQDPITNQWEDGPISWFRVTAFRALASNAMISLRKGDRIVVVGRLKISSYLRKDGTRGSGAEIDAECIGPDLQFGMTKFVRMTSAKPVGVAGESHGDGVALLAGAPDGVTEEGEIPDDAAAEHFGQGEEGDADGDEAAAASGEDFSDGNAFDDGVRVDAETGEILAEAAPY